jgi:hypothetical protein
VRVRSGYVTSYGDIVFELAYWLYGYAEACRNLFELLNDKLVSSIGFKPTKADIDGRRQRVRS